MADRMALYSFLLKETKKLLGIPSRDGLSYINYLKYRRLKRDRKIFKEKYGAHEVVAAMQELGMKEGSNVFIHSSGDQFYNYTGTELELIEEIIKVIGPKGTLMFPAYPLMRPGKVFNLKKTVTKAGMLAEEFRKYPGVKRSINVRHSVCALGPLSDYMLSEHHLGDNCWDEKSPYYKLAEVNALVFTLGLEVGFTGTMVHCVEGVLAKEIPFYRNFFTKEKIVHPYIDYDGVEKTYASYESEKKMIFGPLKSKKYFKKYLKCRVKRVSNLYVVAYDANQVIPTMIENGRKGIVMFSLPSTRGYKFDK